MTNKMRLLEISFEHGNIKIHLGTVRNEHNKKQWKFQDELVDGWSGQLSDTEGARQTNQIERVMNTRQKKEEDEKDNQIVQVEHI